MAIRYGRSDVKQTTTGFRGPLMMQSLTSAKSKFLSLVHSYYVNATERSAILGETTYGDGTFCSAMQKGNLFGCQFHPERSGKKGLMIYKKLLNTIETSK